MQNFREEQTVRAVIFVSDMHEGMNANNNNSLICSMLYIYTSPKGWISNYLEVNYLGYNWGEPFEVSCCALWKAGSRIAVQYPLWFHLLSVFSARIRQGRLVVPVAAFVCNCVCSEGHFYCSWLLALKLKVPLKERRNWPKKARHWWRWSHDFMSRSSIIGGSKWWEHADTILSNRDI